MLIGNRVERVCGDVSHNKLIGLIYVQKFSKETRNEINKLPFPMQYELLATLKNAPASFSQDDIADEEKCMANAMSILLPSRYTRERDKNENHNELFKLLPTLGVDHIFTTNYSYCPEEGCYPDREFEKKFVCKKL